MSVAQNNEIQNIKPTGAQNHEFEHEQNHEIENAQNPTGLYVDSSIHQSFFSLSSDTLSTSTDKKNINELCVEVYKIIKLIKK